MDLQTVKIELAKLILNIENPGLIEKLSDFLKSETKDFWNELSDLDKEEIMLGIKQLDEGKRTNFDDFMKRVS